MFENSEHWLPIEKSSSLGLFPASRPSSTYAISQNSQGALHWAPSSESYKPHFKYNFFLKETFFESPDKVSQSNF